MGLIDDKGRVFGIINIIDLTVLLFIAVVITGVFWLAYNDKFEDIFKGKVIDLTRAAQESPKYANVTITLFKQPYFIANQIKENITIFHGSQQIIINKIKNTPSKIEINNVPFSYDIELTMQLKLTKINERYVYKYLPTEYAALLIGSNFTIKTEKFEVSGITTNITFAQ